MLEEWKACDMKNICFSSFGKYCKQYKYTFEMKDQLWVK